MAPVPASCVVVLLAAFVMVAANANGVASHSSSAMRNPLELVQVTKMTFAPSASIVISVTPSSLALSGTWVTVSWSGVSSPADTDFVALYAPANATFNAVTPVKYEMAASSASHRSSGSGSLKFRVINLRSNMVVVFCRGGLDHPVYAAQSNVIEFVNYNEPLQGHLALTANRDEMRVTWVTRDVGNPTVQWGAVSGVYSYSASATTTSYTKQDMCGAPANTTGWIEPGLLHSAVMTALQPGQRYYYIYGDATFGWSPQFSYVSRPVADSTVNFLAYGDMGQAEIDGSDEQSEMTPSLNTTQLMIQELADKQLIMHIGDISYARGYVSQWDAFFDQILPLATALPYQTNPGNHERDFPNSGSYYTGTDSGGECGVAYERRLPMPTPSQDQPWYSFDFGPMHVIMMSTEHNFTTSSVQYNFLAQDLAAVNRTATPWLIFSGHRPGYVDSTNNAQPDGDQPVATLLRQHLEDLWLKYQVDVCWWGHHHSYQRTCPVYQEKCVTQAEPNGYLAPVHMVIGMAGAGTSTNIETTAPAWIEQVDIVHHGYMRVSLTSASLQMAFVSDWDGSVLDQITLTKS